MTTDNRTNELSKIRQNDANDFAYTEALALVEDVIAIHADRIGTHYEDCYKYHVACLAVAVKRRLAGKEKNE